MVVRAVPPTFNAPLASPRIPAHEGARVSGRHESRDVARDGIDVGEGAHLRAAPVHLEGAPLAGRLHEARQDHARGCVLTGSNDVEEAQVQGTAGKARIVEDLLGPSLGRGVAPAALRPRAGRRGADSSSGALDSA